MKTVRKTKVEEYQDRLIDRSPKPYAPDISFCPSCGNFLKDNGSFIVEYWNSVQNVFYCWCHKCEWRGEIVKVDKIIATEVDE